MQQPGRAKKREQAISERYLDRVNNRLVYLGKSPTPEMWDDRWSPSEDSVREALKPGRGTKWLVRVTRRYLATGDGPILEGGCGLGYNVAALQRAGYETVGIDFAPKTVALIQRVAPELDVRLGDAEALPFDDNSFAGYWSLGVIEHHYSGYGSLAREMTRVIRPGGYLFLTFPFMSPLRRLKAVCKLYRPFTSSGEPSAFYQFALDPSRVEKDFGELGFRKCYFSGRSGLKGLMDEVALIRRPLQALYHYPGRSIILRGSRFLMEAWAFLGAGHSCLLVLQKRR